MKIFLILFSFFLFLSCSVDSSASITNSANSSSSILYSSASFQDLCLQLANRYRATENLPPLSRATERRESCTLDQAGKDLASGVGHKNFGSCEESAQNTAPSIKMTYYKNEEEILKRVHKMMWEDEKQLVLEGVTEYQRIGHYLNLSNKKYSSIACMIAYNQDHSTAWINMNFF